MKTEWKKRPHFAEVAEALGVTTKEILAVSGTKPVHVLFTPEPADLHTMVVHEIYLERDADGILIPMGNPEPRPGLWEEIVAGAKRGLGA